MIPTLILVFSTVFATAALAQGAPGAPDAPADITGTETGFTPIAADTVDLASFLWASRPIVVFANTPADPAFAEQMRHLEARWPELAARDVVVITDTDPAAASAPRQKLRPRGFSVVLMEKDGTVVQRKPSPQDGRELIS